MAVQISDYVDRIAIKKGEFEKVAIALKHIFSSTVHLSGHELKSRISRISHITDLSEATKGSLKERMSSVAEMYNEPESWISNPQNSTAFKTFVVESVKRKATQLGHLTKGEQDRYILDGEAQKAEAQKNQALMQKARLARSQPTSTLDDHQQHEEITLRSYVLQQGLGKLRDPTVPINEDSALLRALAAKKEYRSIFDDLSSLFHHSKPAALVLIATSLKQLSDFGQELRDDKEIALVAVTQNGSALQHSSERLQNDREVVLTALRQDPSAIRFAGNALQNNQAFMLTAIAMLDEAYSRAAIK